MQLAGINHVLRKGQAHRAERLCRDYLGRKPESAIAWALLGSCLLTQQRPAEAVENFEVALGMKPIAPAYGNLIIALKQLGRFEEALRLAEQMRGVEPDKDAGWGTAFNNAGTVFYELGRHEEAETLFGKALAVNPEDVEAKWNRGCMHLVQGNYEEGWEGYEYGFRAGERQLRPYFDEFPDWNGEDLNGKTILIWGEQGLGDEILFASCLNDLQRLHRADIVFDCHPRLEALFKRSFPSIDVRGSRKLKVDGLFDDLSPDYQCPIGSLPRQFRRRLSDFPDRGYLKPDKRRVAALRQGYRIGLAWRGGTEKTQGSLRSIPLIDLLTGIEASERDATWVSLQYGAHAYADVENAKANLGIEIEHDDSAIEDITENANLTASCDLVISVIQTAVHMAGALDVPTWCLTPCWAPWKFPKGPKMPWHPSVTQYHQPSRYDWASVLARVSGDLDALNADIARVS